MVHPADVRYTSEHEWARLEGGLVTVGITGHATDQLGDIVFVELPAVGKKLEAGSTTLVARVTARPFYTRGTHRS